MMSPITRSCTCGAISLSPVGRNCVRNRGYGAIAATIIGLLGPIFIHSLSSTSSIVVLGWLKAYLDLAFTSVAAATLNVLSHV